MSPAACFAKPVALAFALLVTSGCCTKNKCGTPPATLQIRDVSGNRVAGATVDGSGVEVRPCDTAAACDFSLRGASGMITITAPGYKTATAAIEPGEDDCGNAVAGHIEVTLQAEGAVGESTAMTTRRAACGN
jgi:hypothetical protein